jgi:putative sterol carrier protein
MAYSFPSEEYVQAVMDVLNQDQQYAQIARNWEGDLVFVIEPDKGVESQDLPMLLYFDLWHGKCREVRVIDPEVEEVPDAAFTLTAPQANYLKILRGELDPMQAMITRRLKVEGSMAYMLRNVPTVLDFVRCCSSVEIEINE